MGKLPPILLVDDDVDDLFILNRLLLKAGVENKVVTMADPLAAQDHLRLECTTPDSLFIPFVIFTDLHMPQLSGVHLTAWIRAQPRLAAIPVIMVTSSDDPRDKQAAEQAGVTVYLEKYPSVRRIAELIHGIPQRP